MRLKRSASEHNAGQAGDHGGRRLAVTPVYGPRLSSCSSFTADLATSKAQKHLGRVDASTSLVTLHKRSPSGMSSAKAS